MPTSQIRVSPATHTAVTDLARRTGEPMQSIVEKAVEDYKRKLFFEEMTAAYARLKADPAAWEEERAERREWDVTLADGREDE